MKAFYRACGWLVRNLQGITALMARLESILDQTSSDVGVECPLYKIWKAHLGNGKLANCWGTRDTSGSQKTESHCYLQGWWLLSLKLKSVQLEIRNKFFAVFLPATFVLKLVKASCRRLSDVRMRYRADFCLRWADDWHAFCVLLNCCFSCYESDSTALNFPVPWEISKTTELPKFGLEKGLAFMVHLGCKPR